MPNVFIDVKNIKVLAHNYKKETRTVKGIDINPILVITRSCIGECFGLNRKAITKIDREGYLVDYERMVKSLGLQKVAYFRKRGKDNRPMAVNDKAPFPTLKFMDFFQKTYHGWCQFYGDNHRSRMLVDLMYMSMRIHNPNINLEFDIANEHEIVLHNQPIYWNTSRTFKNYSLVCHLILSQNRNVFRDTMKLTTMDGQEKDSHFSYGVGYGTRIVETVITSHFMMPLFCGYSGHLRFRLKGFLLR